MADVKSATPAVATAAAAAAAAAVPAVTSPAPAATATTTTTSAASIPAGTQLDGATRAMFEKLSAYLSAEVAMSVTDYSLLSQLNTVAAGTYGGMADRAVDLVGVVESVSAQYNTLKPSLDSINELDDRVSQLEVVVRQLDAYTLRLHEQFKKAYNL